MTETPPASAVDQFRNLQHADGTTEYVVLMRTGDGPWIQTGGDPFTSIDSAAQYATDLAQSAAERATRYAALAKHDHDPKNARIHRDLAAEARNTEFDIFVRETLPLRRLPRT